MASKTQTPDLLDPFFEDTRSISEKLTTPERSWLPHKPELADGECPNLIGGLVLERGEFLSNYEGKGTVPTLRLLARDGDAGWIVWSIIAFPGWLHSAIERKDPHVGDFCAAMYTGVKPSREKGKSDAAGFTVEVARDPSAVVAVETNDRGNDVLAGSDPVPPIPEVDDEQEGGENDDIPFE